MTSRGIPVTLDYAVEAETGDIVAERMLFRIAKWVLIVNIALLLVRDVVLGTLSVVQNPALAGWWTVYGYACLSIRLWLMIWCLLALAGRRRRTVLLFLGTALVNVSQPILLIFLHTQWQTVLLDVYGAVIFILYELRSESALVMVALLAGRESAAWLRRLNWLTIVFFVLCLVPWLRTAILQLLLPSQRPMNASILPTMDLTQIGMVVCIVSLFALRHEYNRILIRLAAAWYGVVIGKMLLEWSPLFAIIQLETFLSMMATLADHLIATLPLAFLVWFTFRFTDAQRREMGRQVMMAQPEP